MMMRKFYRLILGAASLFALASCETTGDPTQGGLFGWSEDKAQYRLNERQQTLQAIDADTRSQQERGRQLDSQYNQMR